MDDDGASECVASRSRPPARYKEVPMIKVRCPKCRKKFSYKDKHAGRRHSCACGHRFLLPDALASDASRGAKDELIKEVAEEAGLDLDVAEIVEVSPDEEGVDEDTDTSELPREALVDVKPDEEEAGETSETADEDDEEAYEDEDEEDYADDEDSPGGRVGVKKRQYVVQRASGPNAGTVLLLLVLCVAVLGLLAFEVFKWVSQPEGAAKKAAAPTNGSTAANPVPANTENGGDEKIFTQADFDAAVEQGCEEAREDAEKILKGYKDNEAKRIKDASAESYSKGMEDGIVQGEKNAESGFDAKTEDIRKKAFDEGKAEGEKTAAAEKRRGIEIGKIAGYNDGMRVPVAAYNDEIVVVINRSPSEWKINQVILMIGAEEYIYITDESLSSGDSAWFAIDKFKSSAGKRLREGTELSRVEIIYTSHGEEKTFEQKL